MSDQLQNKFVGYAAIAAIALLGSPLVVAVVCAAWGMAFHALHWMVRAATGN